jgi:hypothetical protein
MMQHEPQKLPHDGAVGTKISETASIGVERELAVRLSRRRRAGKAVLRPTEVRHPATATPATNTVLATNTVWQQCHAKGLISENL